MNKKMGMSTAMMNAKKMIENWKYKKIEIILFNSYTIIYMVSSEEYNKLDKYECFINSSNKNNKDLIDLVTNYTNVIESNRNLEDRSKIGEYRNVNKNFSQYLRNSNFIKKRDMLVLLSNELNNITKFKTQLHYREDLIVRWNIIKNYYAVVKESTNENSPLIPTMYRDNATSKKKTKNFWRNHREAAVPVVDVKKLSRMAPILLLLYVFSNNV
jgi:hypothetical protein